MNKNKQYHQYGDTVWTKLNMTAYLDAVIDIITATNIGGIAAVIILIVAVAVVVVGDELSSQ